MDHVVHETTTVFGPDQLCTTQMGARPIGEGPVRSADFEAHQIIATHIFATSAGDVSVRKRRPVDGRTSGVVRNLRILHQQRI